MSAVISQGFPTDGATTRIFEPPQINQDHTKPRYLGFIGSFITPEVAAQRPWTKGGGFEIANPCLRYVKNFLRRGRITPLLRDTHDFLPYDFVRKTMDVDPLSAGYFLQQIPAGYRPPYMPPPNGQGGLGIGAMGGESSYGMMVGKGALPGEQITSLIQGDDNVDRNYGRKGIVEFTDLHGRDYQPQQMSDGMFVDPELWAIQRAIFPDYPVLPPTLDELATLLDAAHVHTSLSSIVDTFQTSLSEFRVYADIYIQNVHQQMRERAPNGYVRPYTAGDLVLLAQLGMERQDRGARQVAPAVANDTDLRDALKQLVALQIEEKQEVARMRQEQRIDTNTMAAAPIAVDAVDVAGDAGQPGQPGTSGVSGASGEPGQVLTNATPEGQEAMAVAMADTATVPAPTPEFVCPCGRPAASLAGLKAHERVCEVARAQKQAEE